MRRNRYLYGATVALAAAIGACLWSPLAQADPPGTPKFRVDPFWPKPLPHNWVTGEVGGTCIDSQDHVFIVTRGFQKGGLVSPEGVGGKPDKSIASPPAITPPPRSPCDPSGGRTGR